MCEFVFKDMVKKAGLEKQFIIESAGTSREELGNPVHYGTRKNLENTIFPVREKEHIKL